MAIPQYRFSKDDNRCYEAQAYAQWRALPKVSALHEGVTDGQYLTNRLELAFLAGIEAGIQLSYCRFLDANTTQP